MRLRIAVVVSLVVVSAVGSAAAQTKPAPQPPPAARVPLARPGSIAVVLANAPIMLLPDATRIPLRTAATGTTLEVVQDGPEWVQVRFNDPDLGVRQGYIQAKYLQRENPLQPLDLSVPTARPAAAAATPAVRADEQEQRQLPAPPAVSPRRQPVQRGGFWFSAGMGLGTITCDVYCSGYANGFSGGLAAGGTLNGHWLLGVGTTGWSRSEGNVSLTAGTFDFRVRAYPSLYHGFFINGGIGLGSVTLKVGSLEGTETGLGLMYGVGWDIRTGRNISLTPFWNGSGIALDSDTWGFGQIGIGVTFH
jgi:hypothetical protein